MNNRAIVSFGTGSHADMLEVARPGLQAYAARHGYRLFTPDRDWFRRLADTPWSDYAQRPVAWWKVPLLDRLLDDGYDELLWVDADVVVLDGSDDLAAEVPDGYMTACVTHMTPAPSCVPCTGVWLVRNRPLMRKMLAEMWRHPDLVKHPWWEQAAFCRLLGPSAFRVWLDYAPNEYLPYVFLRLDYRWDVLWDDVRGTPPDTRFFHATGVDDRVSVMAKQLDRCARGLPPLSAWALR